MAKKAELKPQASLTEMTSEMAHFHFRRWWDPVPDWFRNINKEQWIRFNELELELRKKELEIDKQRIQGLKTILK